MQQHVFDEALDIGNADGEGAHFDSAEGVVASDDHRRRWVKFHDVLHPRLDIADEVAVDEVRRCPTVQNHGELHWARSTGACEEQVADAQWKRRDGAVRSSLSGRGHFWSSLESNWSRWGRGDDCRRRRTIGSDYGVGSARVRVATVTVSVAVAEVAVATVVSTTVIATPAIVTLLLLNAAVGVIGKVCIVKSTPDVPCHAARR